MGKRLPILYTMNKKDWRPVLKDHPSNAFTLEEKKIDNKNEVFVETTSEMYHNWKRVLDELIQIEREMQDIFTSNDYSRVRLTRF